METAPGDNFLFMKKGDETTIYSAKYFGNGMYTLSTLFGGSCDSRCNTSHILAQLDTGEWVLLLPDASTLQPNKNILSSIKAFTITTGATVMISDGKYEVYWDADVPVLARTDEDMEKTMDSIYFLNGAMK